MTRPDSQSSIKAAMGELRRIKTHMRVEVAQAGLHIQRFEYTAAATMITSANLGLISGLIFL